MFTEAHGAEAVPIETAQLSVKQRAAPGWCVEAE